MTSNLDMCRGLTRAAYDAVIEARDAVGRKSVETRGADHSIFQHETKAEEAITEYLRKQSEKRPGLRIGLGVELIDRPFAIHRGTVTQMSYDEIKDFADVYFLVDPIDGSKADIPVLQAYVVGTGYGGELKENGTIQIGGTQEAYVTAIMCTPSEPTLKKALGCSMTRFDGTEFFADEYSAYVSDDGRRRSGPVAAEQLDDININTKFYTAAHYGHAAELATLVIGTLLRELSIPEERSPGVRSTGSTTFDMLQPGMTRSIAFDIRDELNKEMKKRGIAMKRGAYTHDFAPPTFWARRAGARVSDLDGSELDCDLFTYEKASYLVAPPGKAGETVRKVLADKVMPKLPALADILEKELNWTHAKKD